MIALALLVAGPPPKCLPPLPEEKPCTEMATTEDSTVCAVCTLRVLATSRAGFLVQEEKRSSGLQLQLQEDQRHQGAALALGTTAGSTAVLGGLLVGQKHVEAGLVVLGISALTGYAGLWQAGLVRFP